MAKSSVGLALAAILIVYTALYVQTRRFDFVWTDRAAFVDSATFRLPLSEQLRTTDHTRLDPNLAHLEGIALAHDSYRPLVVLSHNVDMRLFGRDPGPMHLDSVLLGALGIVAAFWLALRMLGDAKPALVVAAIFALHPLHAEPLCFLSARADPLAGLLALAAGGLVVEGAARGPRARAAAVAGAFGLMLLSLAAKEAMVLLPVGLACLGAATGRLRAWGRGILALAAAAPVLALLRAALVKGAPVQGQVLLEALVAVPAVCVEYVVTFLVPLDISIARPFYVPVSLGWGVACALALLVVVLLRRPYAPWQAHLKLAAGGAGFAAALAGPSAVAVLTERAAADRYAYLAVFGFALAVVALGRWAARWPPLKWAMPGAAGLFVALSALITATEIPAWASDYRLYAHGVDVEPKNAESHRRLGRLYAEHGAWPLAVQEFEKAVALPNANDRALNDLGVGYLNVGRPRDGEVLVRRALERSGGGNFQAWYNLGTALRMQGDLPGACDAFGRALALSPAYARATQDRATYCEGGPR